MGLVQREWIRAATLAPSGHNSQPWLFDVGADTVRVLPDFSRRLPVADAGDRELFISLGCAAENLVIAASHDGFDASVDRGMPAETGIRLRFRETVPLPHPLYAAVFQRQTNRLEYDGTHLVPEVRRMLEDVDAEPGVFVRIVTDRRDVERVGELAAEADRRQLSDARFRRELAGWLRFNEREETERGDGLSLRAGGHRPAPRWLGRILLPVVAGPRASAHADSRLVRSASALAVVASRDDQPGAWIGVGRSLERLLLHATAAGVQHAWVNQICQVPELREALARRLELGKAWPQIVLRLGFAPPVPRSPRRPLDEVILPPERAAEAMHV